MDFIPLTPEILKIMVLRTCQYCPNQYFTMGSSELICEECERELNNYGHRFKNGEN